MRQDAFIKFGLSKFPVKRNQMCERGGCLLSFIIIVTLVTLPAAGAAETWGSQHKHIR